MEYLMDEKYLFKAISMDSGDWVVGYLVKTKSGYILLCR